MLGVAAQDPNWTDVVSAIGAILIPIVVIGFGYVISRRLSAVENQQWENQALISARLTYYREIAEPLNDLICYFTFIGSWKECTPPDVVAIKRSLDKSFYTLVPFFGVAAKNSYEAFIGLCFQAFGAWGTDAKLKTGCGRRKQASKVEWDDAWDEMFSYTADQAIEPETLIEIRDAYNATLVALVDDVQLTQSRADYVSASVVLKAH